MNVNADYVNNPPLHTRPRQIDAKGGNWGVECRLLVNPKIQMIFLLVVCNESVPSPLRGVTRPANCHRWLRWW